MVRVLYHDLASQRLSKFYDIPLGTNASVPSGADLAYIFQ